MLPNHAPLVVAEQFGTLATLSQSNWSGFRSCARNRSLYCCKKRWTCSNGISSNIEELQMYFSEGNKMDVFVLFRVKDWNPIWS
jgi:hypothetical protein